MTSLFERLERAEAAADAEVAALHEELDAVRKRLDVAEERRRRLAIARETLESLPEDDTEQPPAPSASATHEQVKEDSGAGAKEPGPGDEPEARFGSPGPTDWDEGRRRILCLLATAGKPMKAKEIAAAIGEDVSTPARVETTRARLKRLAGEGHVIEDPVASFAIASADSTGAAEEEAPGES
ncbi:hypothetical protein ACWELB_30135 [Streptomyces asiaticus]